MSVYNPNIPQPGDLLDVSQADLLKNFGQLDTSFGADHYKFSDPSGNNGFHVQSTYIKQAADPNSVAVGRLLVYSKATGPGGSSDLWMVRDNVPSTATQLTTSKIAAPTVASKGNTFLPGGLLYQWGSFSITAQTTSETFSTSFPNACFSVTPILQSGLSSTSYIWLFGAPSVTGFSIRMQSFAGGQTCYYFAIGN